MIQQIDLEQLIKDIETSIKNFINGDSEELNITPPVHIPFIVGVVEHLFRQQGYEVDYDYNTHNESRSIIYTILYNKQADKTITLVLSKYILLHKGNLLTGGKEKCLVKKE